MTVIFNNLYLEKLFEDKPVAGKPRYSVEVINKFKKTVLMLQYVENIRELRQFKGLNFEALKGKSKGYYSVRVDKEYRLILRIGEDQSIEVNEILIIEDLSNHYK
ncbi:MAG TPA: type II toxin-antitoxin system RelE/ParE family toxin [Chitinophagaceae bacterium]